MRYARRVEETLTDVDASPDETAGTGRAQLSAAFRTPQWLRNVGRSSWLLVGLFALLGGLIWLLAATYTIVGPMVCALIVAVVAMPVVQRLDRHMPRALAAAIVLLAVAAVAVGVVVIVIAGITGQSAEISSEAAAGVGRLQGWLTSLGVDSSSASGAANTASSAAPDVISTLVHGVVHGIAGLASVLFGLSFAALGTFFLLKDGPQMRGWLDRHTGLPEPVASTISGAVIRSLRGYFRGVTLVAGFNGVVVGLAALVLGVPLAGTIAVVTFVTAYIPYIGAVVAGAFAVLLALGSQGTGVAIAMLVVVLLANGLLQNIVQPFAMGAALHLNPLVVLVVTISAGCLFGMLGLVLAAPLVSAAVQIAGELNRPLGARQEPDRGPPSAAGDTLIQTG
ncbi:MAG TPA: AI-2E family transporter [Gaiellaceae bacterium]|jgi:predicted PurR-regulated permease PerM|nr:AI-2E family transporter [Gaiellaceae bacterium]